MNYVALILCGVANMAIGTLWYGPLFGKMWSKINGFTKADEEKAKKEGMGKTYGQAFITAVVMAYVLSQLFVLTRSTDFASASYVAMLAWLGFTVATSYSLVLFEKRSITLFVLNAGYYLASFLVMSVILTTLK